MPGTSHTKKADLKTEVHPFKPFAPAGTKFLIIGSFPGKGQAEIKEPETRWFYGAKRNTFWKILQDVYQRELPTTKAKKELLAALKIGMADIILEAMRTAGSNSDDNLQVIRYNDRAIRRILSTHEIETVFFTSQFVYKLFRKFFPGFKATVVLPSPSPRYARMRLEEKIKVYMEWLPELP